MEQNGKSCISCFSVGNCKVEIQGKCTADESSKNKLLISVSDNSNIRISVDSLKKCGRGRSSNTINSIEIKKIEDKKSLGRNDYSFCLLHSKDMDSQSKSLHEEVLKLYKQELPSMAYAANTGKNSDFLEKCIFNGKYKTLIILKLDFKNEGPQEVIAAISYQIIHTEHAEIPLAVVRSNFQKKGFGQLLCKELSMRLKKVGISTIFCWADEVTQIFWLKQGFVLVGEVDSKGKSRKLPIKADIKRKLCFPCDSKLMVSHLKNDILISTCSFVNIDSQICNSNGERKNCEKRLKRQKWENPSLTSLRSKRISSLKISGDNDNYFPKIMFMNMADDSKKMCLTKIVEDLGGKVTSEGNMCTHVITGKPRRTLNFCIALCSGAWVVSPSWLKESFKEGYFVEESKHVLEDVDYPIKYKCELRDAVMRAKENPSALLLGYKFCISKHIEPSVDILTAIIKSGGGNVISRFDESSERNETIFLVCEEDMEDAMNASKRNILTFSSEWLMNCVMKQELDLNAQFAESL